MEKNNFTVLSDQQMEWMKKVMRQMIKLTGYYSIAKFPMEDADFDHIIDTFSNYTKKSRSNEMIIRCSNVLAEYLDELAKSQKSCEKLDAGQFQQVEAFAEEQFSVLGKWNQSIRDTENLRSAEEELMRCKEKYPDHFLLDGLSQIFHNYLDFCLKENRGEQFLKQKENRMEEITDRLEQGIQDLFESSRYKEYLQVMSRFHNYSFKNTLLIAMQKPEASLVASYTSWKNKFGRQVRKGEKGIHIIAPSPYKVKEETPKMDPDTGNPITDENGVPVKEEREITRTAFKVVSVFDVSQTEGKELPAIANELTGNVEQYADFFKAAELTASVPVIFKKTERRKGYYSQTEKHIVINEGMSELQNMKTLIHEIAHAKLHDIDLNAPKEKQGERPDRRTREVQAESVAYAVCQHYGLDTSDYSFGYIAGWSSGKELTELKASLETIRNTASEIINGIDARIAEMKKERGQDTVQEAPAQEGYFEAKRKYAKAR